MGGDEPGIFHSYSSILILGIIAILVADQFWYSPASRGDFYNELWGPATLLRQGKSPYDTSGLNPAQPAGWFPMAIGFFFPLGWLNENVASQVWLVFNILEICLMIYIAQGERRTVYTTLILAMLCFFFPPTFHHFVLGQISVTVSLCLVLAVEYAEKGRNWVTAFWIALAFSKPHLAALPGLGLCYSYYLHGKTKRVISFAGRILVMVIILSVPLFVAYPDWIPDALESITKIIFWPHPALFVFFLLRLGSWGYAAWILSVVVVLTLFCLLWIYHSPRGAMYWSMAFSALISPYVGSWDFVTLLPLLIYTFSRVDWGRRIFLVLSYGVAWYLMALVHSQHAGLNYYFWWVPLWLMSTLALITNWKRREVTDDIHPSPRYLHM